MSDTPDLMTHERIMTGEEYVSYSDYLLLQHSRDEWAKMCGRYKQERDEAREQNAKLVSISEIAIDELAWFHDIIAHKLWNKLEQLKKEAI